jgi:hypothetical protein
MLAWSTVVVNGSDAVVHGGGQRARDRRNINAA